jgi:O-antigen/teichoic acid export membrane protein
MSFTQLVGSAIHFTLPMASEFHGAGQKDLLQQLFTKASRFVVFFSTGCAVMLLTLGDKILTIWVGPGISASARTVMVILVAAAYLQAVTIQLANNAALGMGHIGAFTLYSAIRASLIAVGCVALIRPLGLEGAAVAIISATVVDVFYMANVVRRYLNLSLGMLFRNAYAKPLSLGLVTAMLAIACRPLVTSWISFGIVATALLGFYVAVAGRTGVLEDSEKKALRELLRGVVHARTQV